MNGQRADPALQAWAQPQLRDFLPLEDEQLEQIIAYAATLSGAEIIDHFTELLGDSQEVVQFAIEFKQRKAEMAATDISKHSHDVKIPNGAGTEKGGSRDSKLEPVQNGQSPSNNGEKAPPPTSNKVAPPTGAPPAYAPPAGPPPGPGADRRNIRNHTNQVIEAGKLRARDEQEMQQALQSLQYQYRIYNSDIEPEHESDFYCGCPIHQYKRRKWNRYGVQREWSKAVMYPGEKAYDDNTMYGKNQLFSGNPYTFRVVSPYGYWQNTWAPPAPIPGYYTRSLMQTIELNNALNREAQASINKKEPKHSIWEENQLEGALGRMNISDEKRRSLVPTDASSSARPEPKSRLSSFRKTLGIKSSDERTIGKAEKAVGHGSDVRSSILREEQGRWPDELTQALVTAYQQHMGMYGKIADLRNRSPIQYLHLLRAGYFEPIPVAWANDPSNPLKFSIEAAAGWRGITPAWRGYEDTAEERLYWVLNHREGAHVVSRLKPDYISEMRMAQERMAKAVPPPPDYYSATDQCHIQHTSAGYSKQVMPAPLRLEDRPETATDDTMILLDVSGSMDFDPVRPIYNEYLVTGWSRSTQPKNKDVAHAIIRRFTDAMENHDHQFQGYDLVTFANNARHIGTINHQNFDQMWRNVRLGGGTRVMTGWQKVKELHFQKHSESASHHPIYGWQAGPETPMLRLLLLLDGEATDMDEFELDLLGLSWAHVTIFLIGVDGCPHHHRHANELQRISDVNHHVSFVDAQGNCPERFVTHELLKRHLGYEISMSEFETMEELPAYSETG
ncbi:hypothetical protein M409DRAFT_60379 [Zasmidium cellare ATCC 36951]|uniref:VWFA domain-containing protein n=1 Tax=Zasmidium cellare ATCC 36951 TaxID=1080233 RepID=A0A6A6C3K8_ZASCE|nr:uncharacterized protein M409DRAFT_60379 [Zasmidium cellare ATCC 36951]KAF2159976.1 hypothetical protein M409DRAFT_60379 [Zasmidium cellare ATCC 36951]